MAIEDESSAAWLLAEIGEDKAFAEKYQLEAELGYGAAGVVIGARHRVLDQRVAIKFLLSGKENAEATARFLREARAASRIRNQHVVRVIDASTLASGVPYLVMEYLDGVDLERMLHESPHRQLPVTDAIDLILQTGEALAECHCVGIVHRDLKPSNLFCVHGADGLPMIKVLDFGIAKLGKTTIEAELPEGAVGGARQRRVFGSPAYMSPEQFESSSDVDLRSDIWALGVILYEFVTGELPFQETSIYRIRKRVTEDTPRPIRELRRDAPVELWPVISKCIAKDPNQRYKSLAELAKALVPFASPRAQHSVARIVRTIEAPGSDTGALSLSVDSTSSRRSSLNPLVRTFVQNRRPRTAVFGAVALIAVLGGSIWLNGRRAAPAISTAAPIAPAVTTATTPTLLLSAPSLSGLAPSAGGESAELTPVARPSPSTGANAQVQNRARVASSRSTASADAPATTLAAPSAVLAPVVVSSGGTSSNSAPIPPISASGEDPDSPPPKAAFPTAPAPSVTGTASADPKWPVPIIVTRKRPHSPSPP